MSTPSFQPVSRSAGSELAITAVVALFLIGLLPVLHATGQISTFTLSLWGKYLCYALLAISVNLLWGYTGLLSLGQALFFALGGYMHGMYLMRMIGDLGQYHKPIPDFLVFLGWTKLPAFWEPFASFPFALAMVLLHHDIPVALDRRFTLIHRHAARAVTPARAIEADTRNNIWIAFKYFPLPLAIGVALLHTTRRFAMAVVKRKPGGRQAVVRGARAGLTGLGDVLAYRTPIPVSMLARHNRWFFQMFYTIRAQARR